MKIKRSVYTFMAVLFFISASLTKLIWSGENPMIAQMEHKALGADMSQMKPMSEMKQGHKHDEHHKQMNTPDRMPPRSILKPAEGARVKILSPKNGDQFQGDEIELHFELLKGKRGNHVHAYVDGELMGMFTKDEGTLNGSGTLTGIRPGHHTLELRVVTKDHNTELDATDRVKFMVK